MRFKMQISFFCIPPFSFTTFFIFPPEQPFWLYCITALIDSLRGKAIQDERTRVRQKACPAQEGNVHELPAPLDCRQYAGYLVLSG